MMCSNARDTEFINRIARGGDIIFSDTRNCEGCFNYIREHCNGVNDKCKTRKVAIKPPLGLTPKYIWNSQRLQDISEAIARYTNVGKEIPAEWLEEYNKLVRIKK